MTDRQQLLEGVVKVKLACIHSIGDLRVWRLNLALASVDVPEIVEDSVRAHRVFVIPDVLGAARVF